MNVCRVLLTHVPLLVALLAAAGCALYQPAAPIESRGETPASPATHLPPPLPKPALAPPAKPGAPVIKPLPDVESPAVRAIPLPESGAAPLSPDAARENAPQAARAPAIAELIAKADRSSAQGQVEAARANLERAVKIAPRDAELWQRLAMLSYAQGDWAQARSLAERSNSFAAQGSPLAARNWTLIGNAELKLGNQSAAAAAFNRSGGGTP